MSGHARRLIRDVGIYGVGDVLTSVLSFLLIPLYTRVLTPEDYSVLAMILTLEAATKIGLRLGLDASFLRLGYEHTSTDARQTLASTTFFILSMVNVPILVLGVTAAPWLSPWMFPVPTYTGTYTLVLQLALVNIFVMGFSFIPFQVLRMEGRTTRFASFTFGRAIGTVAVRILFVLVLKMGLLGLVYADLLVTAVVSVCLLPAWSRLLRPRFSIAVAREALGFGLPRVPHGLAHQGIANADKWVLNRYAVSGIGGITPDHIGSYQMGNSIAQGLKLFMGAVEYAWAPFYLEIMHTPEAPRVLARMTTYVMAVLVLLAAGLAAAATDLVAWLTPPAYHAAAVVVPWVGLGIVLQGFFQLTAIGLNITRHTRQLPIATGVAMLVAIALNLILIPRFGILGAGYSIAAAYGTLAAIGLWLSLRVYPIPYEWRRLLLLAGAGIAALVVARAVVPAGLAAVWGLMFNAATVLVVYTALLASLGFLRSAELNTVRALLVFSRRQDT